MMVTVVTSPAVMAALSDLRWQAVTAHLVQPDFSTSGSELEVRPRAPSGVAQLPADSGGIDFVEVIVAHRSPFTIVEDLHTTFVWAGAIDQTDWN